MSSNLDLPQPSEGKKPACSPTRESSPSTDSTSGSSYPVSELPRSDKIRSELERRSKDAVELMMRCEYDDPILKEFSPEFKSVYNGVPASVGRDALWNHFIWLSKKYPDQHTRVVDAVADVDERRGRAKVWMTVMVSGLPGDLQKEGVSLFCWEKRQDKWVCWKHVGMGGVQHYT